MAGLSKIVIRIPQREQEPKVILDLSVLLSRMHRTYGQAVGEEVTTRFGFVLWGVSCS